MKAVLVLISMIGPGPNCHKQMDDHWSIIDRDYPHECAADIECMIRTLHRYNACEMKE